MFCGQPRGISIHAPRTGSDQLYELGMLSPTQFQSTLPARGATIIAELPSHLSNLFQSTLPARGATPSRRADTAPAAYFNPRSPHGERLDGPQVLLRNHAISIHAPRTGSDCWRLFFRKQESDFNPRSPHGERPERDFTCSISGSFQSTLPARGATAPH